MSEVIADRGGARTKEQDALRDDQRIQDLERGRQACQHDGPGTLDVVIVAEYFVFVAREDTNGIRAFPILEVEQAVRVQGLHGLHEFFNQLVQLVLRRRRVTNAKVERVRPQRRVCRANVAQHRQQPLRRDCGASRIELEFADRDAHAVGPDIAEAEYAATGRNANGAYVRDRPIGKDFRYPAVQGACDIHAARTTIDMAELQAGLCDGRIVGHRDEAGMTT